MSNDASSPAQLVCYPDDETANIARVHRVILRCSHDTDDPNAAHPKRSIGDNEALPKEFAVVADAKPDPDGVGWSVTFDTVEIITKGGSAPAVDGETLSVARTDDRGRNVYTWDVPTPELEIRDVFDLNMWADLVAGRTFEVRRDGETLTTIVSYPPHQFMVKVKVPAAKTITKSNKEEVEFKHFKEAYESTKRQRRESKRWRPLRLDELGEAVRDASRSSSSREDTRWSALTDELTLTTSDGTQVTETRQTDGVSVVVNGVEIGARYTQLLDNFMALGRMLEGIIDHVGSLPKVGWYIDTTIELMSGEVTMAWGWKEYRDYQGFLWMGADYQIKLFKVRWELGFGIYGSEMLQFEAVIFMFMEGEVSVGYGVERDKPGLDPAFKVPLPIALKGGLGGRVKIPYAVSGEATGETGVSLKNSFIKIDQEKGPYIEGEWWWEGFRVNVKGSIGAENEAGGSKIINDAGSGSGREYQGNPGWMRIEPQKLGHLQFPEYEQEVTPARMKEILQDEFEGGLGWDLRVKNQGTGETMGAGELADEVRRAILRRPDVPRTNAVVESIGKEVRSHLRPYLERRGVQIFPTIAYTVFLEYVHGDEDATDGRTLQQTLDAHADESLGATADSR